jgi:hypothetical protein
MVGIRAPAKERARPQGARGRIWGDSGEEEQQRLGHLGVGETNGDRGDEPGAGKTQQGL